MYTDVSMQEQAMFFDVILSGGPPWGFTLAGGSEFGSKLYVKKVTDEQKADQGTLYSGDEILSVNGAICTSRANAIQMVRSIDDELRLTIRRWGNHPDGPSHGNEEHNKSQSHVYTNMVENMNDLSTSTYSLKRNSIQRKHMNENTVNGNYKILSINKSNESNEHNIRIGIDPQFSNEHHFDGYNDNSVDGFNIKAQSHSSTPQFNQRQKVTVKMVPVPQAGSKLLTNTQSQHSSKLMYPDQTDYVEHESLQKVSTARAMFENMSSHNKVPQKFVHHNATSPVIGQTVEKHKLNASNQTASPVHAHSRSLPIEMAGKEFERAMQAYRNYREVDNGSSVGSERPKSAHYYNDSPEHIDVPVVPTRYSQSELLKSFRTKGPQHSFDQPTSIGASHSTEDLRNYSDQSKVKISPGIKKDPANELRQAANRYHQELMKNYPKFIHSIAGKDNTGKFSRKISMPPDDAFSRGEPHRATIATTSVTRIPRSYSAGNTLEMTGVQDFLNKSNDNSMMSRLLRDQNLVKIEEESKFSTSKSKSDVIQTDLRRCSTEPEKALRNPDKSVPNPNSYYGGVEGEPLHAGTVNIRTGGYHSNHQEIKEGSVSPQPEHKMPEAWPHGEFIETDIDSEEAEQIIHRKDPSTDSAVYVMHENVSSTDSSHNMSDVKTLNKESSDSMNELSQITDKATQKVDEVEDYDDSEFLPPPPDELLHDEDDHEEYAEKENKKRTINRKKKDSYAVSSRNNSCVSTDSTTSTTTVDSGIVIRSEGSPRTSPVSSERYYTGSRERLDDDVSELNGGEPHATSTPERHGHTSCYTLMHDNSLDNRHNPSTSDNRQDSMDIPSPRIEDLDGEKSKLMDSMREKICELRDQEQEIADEIKMNEELGKKVLNMVEAKATQSEFSKYELFIGELNKIVALLLSLTQRLHRYELMLQDLDMSNEADKAKKDVLVSKIDKLKSQHEEACYLRDVNDKRGDNVATFLEKYCSEEEFADFQYYVDMKSQLALMQSEIREKVKLGEERLKALELTGSEWGFG